MIAFLVPLPPVQLRRNSETGNKQHLAVLKKRYSESVWRAWLAAGRPGGGKIRPWGCPWPMAKLRIEWRSVRMTPDRDNVVTNCKALIDALRCQQPQDGAGRFWLGLIENDDPACLLAVEADVRKLGPSEHEAEGVWIELTRVVEEEQL